MELISVVRSPYYSMRRSNLKSEMTGTGFDGICIIMSFFIFIYEDNEGVWHVRNVIFYFDFMN